MNSSTKLSLMIYWSISIVMFLSVYFITKLPTLNPKTNSNPIREYSFSQPLDHFGHGNMSKIIFLQRYYLDYTHWSGSNSTYPLIVYFGGESNIKPLIQLSGVVNEAALKFKALVLYIEHRFYGKSIPYGSIDIALNDREVRGCLTSQQALMDFAKVILDVRQTLLDQHAPIIVTGCSYAGMLAAWFRLKYPHIAMGAIASSAPVLFFDPDIPSENKYFSVVSHDYKIVSEKCYDRIKKSWAILDNIGSQRAAGHAFLTTIFKTCSPVLSVEHLKSSLEQLYAFHAQYNGRFNGGINSICTEINRAPNHDLIGRVALAAIGEFPCYDVDSIMAINTMRSFFDLNSIKAWDWQTCSEFIMRMGCGNDTMFQPNPFNLTKTIESCNMIYYEIPHLDRVSTYYGGNDIRSSFRDFGSNIIFTNGLMDPFSPFGVLEDISKSVVALTTQKGSHCLDFSLVKHDDPKWLKQQRERELKILSNWIEKNHSSNHSKNWLIWFCFILIFTVLY